MSVRSNCQGLFSVGGAILASTILFGAVTKATAATGDQGESGPRPGVPLELARFRAAHYTNVEYDLEIEIAPGAAFLKGTQEIRLTLDNPADDLVLDWRTALRDGKPQHQIHDIQVNGKVVADARLVNDHIVIPARHLRPRSNSIKLRFESPISTSGSAVTSYLDREDGSQYVYTLFVPSDASTAFPCFDQPDLKGRFALELTASKDWKAIANTPAEGVAEDLSAGTKRWRFGRTEPISTYLFAFATGPFAEIADDGSNWKTHIFVRRSKLERAKKESSEIFRITREGLAYFIDYFDFKYPFPKYDLVVIPEFAYGGMEHAGATFMNEDAVLFPTEPTANNYLARAQLILHETAHQWFGDLVTMRWFDDLWLKEGFATFMAAHASEVVMPGYDAWKTFCLRTKPAAYATDATKGTTPIWQQIPNLSAAKSAYGNIVYNKAPSMLRQAEFFLGAREFQAAVRLLVKDRAYANAEWSDLVHDFERTSGLRLATWADAWVKRRGMPAVQVDWSVAANGRIDRFVLKQSDVLGEGGQWPMRLKVFLAYPDAEPAVLTVTLDAKSESVSEALGRPAPSYVFANYDDYGYGRFLLDAKSRQTVLSNLASVKNNLLRALLWSSLWESVREAELAPRAYLDLGIRLIAGEEDEIAVQSILSHMETAFNRYLTPGQAEELAPRLEGLLSDRMQRGPAKGLRITYFRAFESVAMTESGRSILKRLLSGELQIPEAPLRSRDRFDIITRLLARRDKDAAALLRKEKEADTSDSGRRYAYAAGAASADQAVKQQYFATYAGDSSIPENWLEASLDPFNSADQSELTLPLLENALKLLPRLKRTRKIFFVNRWLAAFIGGQCSQPALTLVQNFLGREELDRDLRLKVLEAVDGLERCIRIRRN
jgi:aminopeptidase N